MAPLISTIIATAIATLAVILPSVLIIYLF